MKQPVKRQVQRRRKPFQYFQSRHGVPILQSRNVTTHQAGSLLQVPLRKPPATAEVANPYTNTLRSRPVAVRTALAPGFDVHVSPFPIMLSPNSGHRLWHDHTQFISTSDSVTLPLAE